jgi:prevent-host-death family protein
MPLGDKPMKQANIHEAKTHLSDLIERAIRGEEIIIARAGKPVVRLVRFETSAKPREGGQWAGLGHIGDDFDDPLPTEIASSFEGKSP